MSIGAKTVRLALAALLSSVVVPAFCVGQAHAQEAPGVDALLKQADYWRQKGRGDLAERALSRARQLAPDSVRVKAASRAPVAKPASTPVARPRPVAEPVPALTTKAAPAAASAGSGGGDRGGSARAAGFNSLESGKLQDAAAQFQRAVNANGRDADALGGLGIVRLRQSRFGEAADLLERASRYGNANQWAEGLRSARFFAGIANARALMSGGQLDQAQAQAEQLVRSGYPERAPAFELLADIYEKQGRFADAADLYRQAGTGGAQDEKRLAARAARGRALAAAQRGDYDSAEREFQSGLLLDREDPWIRYEFARFMIDRNRPADAESLLRSLSGSQNPDSLYAAALIRNDLGQSGAAEQLLDQVPEAQRTAAMRNLSLKLKTDSAIARAKALGQTGRAGEGIASLQQIANMGVPAGSLPALANAMYDLGDQAGAAMLAERAYSAGVSNLEDYQGLVGALVRVGRQDLAEMAMQRAQQQAGNAPDRQRLVARMQGTLAINRADQARQAGYYADAFDMLQSAWNAAPENTDVLSALGRLYQSGGLAAPAAQTYQLVLARDPKDKGALLGLAASAQAAGDKSLSRRAQDDALRTYPTDYEVRMALADVERARGDEGAAIKLLKQARELYLRQQGAGSAMMGPGGNPFAAMGASGNNPFRNQAPQASTVNPFALGSGTRLPAAPAYGSSGGYGNAPMGGGYAPAPTMGGGGGGGSPWSQQYAPMPGSPNGASSASPFAAAPYGGAPGYSAQNPQPGPIMGAYSGDPVMAKLQSDIAALSQESGPRADFEASYRGRSGETGLSKLDEIKGSTKLSTDLGPGRIYGKLDAVVIDAGRPTGSGLARFGRNGTIEAQAIVDKLPSPLVDAGTQHDSGVAFAAGYESDAVQAEVGTTPMGMGKTNITFSAVASPKIGNNTRLRAWIERKPVTDSIISYAGTRDPVTGERWGQVMRTGGGIGASYDENGTGIYAEGRYNKYKGTNVRKNDGFEANVGGYFRVFTGPRSTFTAGLNVNYQKYDNNQNYFTFGHGGYFSPQEFISLGFPLRYSYKDEKLDLNASITPGFQSYSQDQVGLYPTDATAQATLDALKAENDDVRSFYDSLSKTGFAVSADASLYYKVSPTMQVGGMANYNTFGNYNEFRSMLGVRKNFGSGDK